MMKTLEPLKLVAHGMSLVVAACVLLSLAACSGSSPFTPATSQVAVSVASNAVSAGAVVTLTATLTTASSPAPIGTITFYDGTAALQAVNLNGSTTVKATIAGFAAGSHTITASYGGDQTHAAAVSGATVIGSSTTTTTSLTASPTLAAVGDPVTLTATVAATNYVPTGSVSFTSNGVALGTAALGTGANGQVATLVTTSLPLGTDAVVASYVASAFGLASTSSAVAVQIHTALIPTANTLTVSPAGTVAAGTLLTLSAAVKPVSGTTPLTGTIAFYDGTRLLGTMPISSSNTATLQTKQLNTGSNALTAVYTGDAVYGGSSTAMTALTLTAFSGATYTNPLQTTDPATGKAYNCPDPAILKTTAGTLNTWYAYCTGDAFNSADTVTGGGLKVHLISIFSSTDLVNWTYVKDALSALPTWAQAGQEPQTPAIKKIGANYVLYYETPSGTAPNGAAVAVATSATPVGPFVDSGAPLVDQSLLFSGGPSRTKNSPEVVADGTGQLWLVYGGIYGGITIRQLTATGTALATTDEISIGVDNYYTNPYIYFHNGYFYEMLTAGACCSGPYSTYVVHVGRSTSITGPYDDAEGNDLNAYSTVATRGAPGGDSTLVMNGNDIVGAGSNTVFTDESGQDYIFYSGVSKQQPYLPNVTGYTARQLMMDALDYVNGFPVARYGAGPSDASSPQPVPAAQPGGTNGYVPPLYVQDSPGTAISASSDDFNTSTLSSQWSFLHTPASYVLNGSAYVVQSVSQESVVTSSMPNLPILAEPEPSGNYMLEVKVAVSDKAGAFNTDNNQAGIFIYSSDSVYLRLDEFPYFDTEQIEYLNQYGPGIPTAPNNFSFAPGGTPNFYANTYMRIAKRILANGSATYTSYSSTDGVTYLTGPTWTVKYPAGVKIGLFAGHTAGYTASFDYIHVTTLQP